MIQVRRHYESGAFLNGKDTEVTSATLTLEETSATNVHTTAETFHETFNHRRQSQENHAGGMEPELFFILLGLVFLIAFGIALWFYVKN